MLQIIFRVLAIISYLLIFLSGDIIAVPLFFWLPAVLLSFGDIDQLFALLAFAGMFINFVNMNKEQTLEIFLLDILCFLLLASPVASRMIRVPIRLFNYNAFIIPAVIFVVLYTASLYFGFRRYMHFKATVSKEN